jgi:DNA ligase (NAD+)
MGFINIQQKEVKSNNNLEKLLDYYSDSYYKNSVSEISDEEFDALKERYKKETGKDYEKVGGSLSKKLKKETHVHQMLSLEKVNTQDGLEKWVSKFSHYDTGLCIDWKLDGVSLSLVYVYGHLLKAVTRGNGNEGENVSHNIFYIKINEKNETPVFIPTFIDDFRDKSYMEIRGEVVISKSNFEEMKKQNPEFVSARNLASGSIRTKNNDGAKDRNLEFFAYYIYNEQGLSEDLGGMDITLTNLGFKTPRISYSPKPELFPNNWFEEFAGQKDSLNYQTDGLVIKLTNKELIEKLGNTSHHPRSAVAFKFKSDEEWTILKDVEWQTSATGRINPVGVVEPVSLCDAMIENVSLHNLEIIEGLKLHNNDEVLITRANDVIPFLKARKQTDKSCRIIIPSFCPACNSAVSRKDKFLYCTNPKCSGVLKHKILKFSNILDINGIGDVTAQKIAEDFGKVDLDYYTILDMTLEEWVWACDSDVLGQKIYDQIRTLLENKISPAKAVATLFIEGIGINVAEKILEYFTYQDLKKMTYYDFVNIDGIGTILAKNLHEINKNPAYSYLAPFVKEKESSQVLSGNLQNLAFCVTGTLPVSRTAAEDLIKQNGGKIKGISKELNYLIVGDSAGGKLEKAQKLGVKCISYDEFMGML